MWFYLGEIFNLLSMSRGSKNYRVTFDSVMDNCVHAHKNDGKTLQFQEASMRLYCFDIVNRDKEGTMLIHTVDENESKMSTPDLTQTKRARALQRKIGRPITRNYIHYVIA